MQDRLAQSERLMAELSRSWEEKEREGRELAEQARTRRRERERERKRWREREGGREGGRKGV